MPRLPFACTFLLLGSISFASACGGGDYVTPPLSIANYLSFLPRKTFDAIRQESLKLKDGPIPTEDEISRAFARGTSVALVAKCDEFLARTRAAECAPPAEHPPYEHPLINHGLINALENFRDVAASGAGNPKELDEYIVWRFDHLTLSDTDFKQLQAKHDAASPELKPAWEYLEGAALFQVNPKEACTHFNNVLSDPKGGPFQEMALFMKARCYQAQANPAITDPLGSNNPMPDDKQRPTAIQCFRDYLDRCPTGRFASDAWGWLGGLEPDQIQAFCDFAKEGESAEHPETLNSAAAEMERIFNELDYTSKTASFDEIAQHPELALFMCYVVLGSPPFEPEMDKPQEEAKTRKRWRTSSLAALGAAVLKHQDLYKGRRGESAYLSILAHQASDDGDQVKALELVDMAVRNGPLTDDLYFVKSLALQRCHRTAAAVACFRDMIDNYPHSPFVPGARYRLALALHDLGKNGEALQQLAWTCGGVLPLNYTTEFYSANPPPQYWFRPSNNSAVEQDLGQGLTQDEIEEMAETLINYSPVESLLPPLQGTDPALEHFRLQLREAVVARYLAQDDFSSAAKWMPDPTLQGQFEKNSQDALMVKAAAAKDLTAAQKANDLADDWLKNQFKRTRVDCLSLSVFDEENAQTLNIPISFFREQHLNRDELAHACTWWQRAWELDPGETLAPNARWQFIQAQRTMTERDDDLGIVLDPHLVKKCYDMLIGQFPNSIFAKKYAVYWSVPKKQPLVGTEGYSDQFRTTLAIRDVPYPQKSLDPTDDSKAPRLGYENASLLPWFTDLGMAQQADDLVHRNENYATWDALLKGLSDLPVSSANDTPAEFEGRVQLLMKQIRPHATFGDRIGYVNGLDELLDLGKVEGLDSASRTAFVKGDRNVALSPLIQDFLDAQSVLQGTMTAEAFLEKYPKSLRRDVVRYHQLRLAVRGNQDVAACEQAFGDYQKEFPNGRFHNGILWLRGLFEENQKHWGQAVEDYMAVIQQKESPELHLDAAAHASCIFELLNQDEGRREVLDDLKRHSVARRALRQYATDGELPYLTDFVMCEVKE